MNQTTTIHLSQTDVAIWGVCGGLAEHFGHPSVLYRLALVALTLCNPPITIIMYLAAGMFMQTGPPNHV